MHNASCVIHLLIRFPCLAYHCLTLVCFLVHFFVRLASPSIYAAISTSLRLRHHSHSVCSAVAHCLGERRQASVLNMTLSGGATHKQSQRL